MRATLHDILSVRSFWLMDVAPLDFLSAPILSPLFGCAKITAPEITLEVEEIPEGNWPFARKVIKGGSVGSITLERGATFSDSDFYRWIMSAALGDNQALQSRGYGVGIALAGGDDPAERLLTSAAAAALSLLGLPKVGGATYRRDMLLIQFFPKGPGVDGLIGSGIVGASIAGFAGAAALNSAAVTAALSFGNPGNGPFGGPSAGAFRLPARAWKLRGCIPMRYKVGGDFAGDSSDLSIMELEMAVEFFEEISLAS